MPPIVFNIMYVDGVAWVMPVMKVGGNGLNHLYITIFMNNFNPERNASRPVGLHVYLYT